MIYREISPIIITNPDNIEERVIIERKAVVIGQATDFEYINHQTNSYQSGVCKIAYLIEHYHNGESAHNKVFFDQKISDYQAIYDTQGIYVDMQGNRYELVGRSNNHVEEAIFKDILTGVQETKPIAEMISLYTILVNQIQNKTSHLIDLIEADLMYQASNKTFGKKK